MIEIVPDDVKGPREPLERDAGAARPWMSKAGGQRTNAPTTTYLPILAGFSLQAGVAIYRASGQDTASLFDASAADRSAKRLRTAGRKTIWFPISAPAQ